MRAPDGASPRPRDRRRAGCRASGRRPAPWRRRSPATRPSAVESARRSISSRSIARGTAAAAALESPIEPVATSAGTTSSHCRRRERSRAMSSAAPCRSRRQSPPGRKIASNCARTVSAGSAARSCSSVCCTTASTSARWLRPEDAARAIDWSCDAAQRRQAARARDAFVAGRSGRRAAPRPRRQRPALPGSTAWSPPTPPTSCRRRNRGSTG